MVQENEQHLKDIIAVLEVSTTNKLNKMGQDFW